MIRTLKGLLTVAAKKDIRFYLNGIHVVSNSDASIVSVQASDGHVGIVLELTSGLFTVAPDTEVILCRNSLETVLKMFTVSATPALEVSNQGAKLGGYEISLIDGRYPDINRAMRLNETSTVAEMGLDFEILNQLCKSCALVLHNEKFINGKFAMRGNNAGLLVERKFNKDKDLLRAVIMPVRL